MLRAGVRTLRSGVVTSRISAGSPLAQWQTRGTAQSLRSCLSKTAPKRRTNTIPIDDIFDVDASSLGFGKKKKNGSKTVPKVNTKLQEPRQKNAPSRRPSRMPESRQQPQSKRNEPVIYSKDYIQSIFEVPTAAEYRISFEPATECSKLLDDADVTVRRSYEQMSPKVTELKQRCLLVLTYEDGHHLKAEGHGMTKEEAAEAASLHAVCKLHKGGLLREILPGGRHNQYGDVSPAVLRQEIDAKKDIIDFAARHHCLPVFSLHKTARKTKKFRAHVSIPALGLDGYGKGHNPTTALLQACIFLKKAAEARHEEIGRGLLLVKDYTELTTESAEKFVHFYCYRQGIRCVAETYPAKEHKTGGSNATKITLQCEPTTSGSSRAPGSGRSSKPLFDKSAWPGLRTPDGSEEPEMIFEGIPMNTKSDAEATAYLAAALALQKESALLWQAFVKEMRRGNGDILKPLSPIDVGVDGNTLEIMGDTVQDISIATKQNKLKPTKFEEQNQRRAASSRQLNEDRVKRKSDLLKRRLALYEMDTSLADLRQKRSELPMVQYRNQVMKMVNENEVCVVVGATGSGKTTQLPQIILEELIRADKGGSCNIICTQPRRIAAISVAERVAVERNEPLRQSVGYTVRFDAKYPQIGGSIHYCTTGILLKQMQENQDATLEGISHIIVDEVHERDLNIDFLLVILRQLMADRRAAGKPPIKVILMSATIDTTLFCKYFGETFETGMCPFIEVPGRTFPVTSHFLNDIYSELKSTYNKEEAADLFSRDSEDYIGRELTNPPNFLAPVAADPGDGEDVTSKALINWKSKGIIGDDGELDIAMEKEDTLTPVGIMGVTIAHLLKTTTEGSILVFLPGLQEIVALERQLMNTRPLGIDFANNFNYKVYTLHSSIPQMQQEVFEKLGPWQRKIILATNIAETSITIPDVVYVVDSSKHREMQFDRARNISNLISTWTAKSNARQRAGRAGRVQNGHYYTMASKARYGSFEASPKPEILRTDLKNLCLQIKSIGVQDIWDFLRRAIEPPSQATVEIAIEELQALRALDDEQNLTPLGRLLSSLPLSPSLGRMVVLAAIFKCLDPILILAAASTSKDPFLSPLDKRDEAQQVKAKWARGTSSDHVALINAFQEWRRLRLSGRWERQTDRQFAHENFLHMNTLIHIAQVADQILDTLEESGIIEKIASGPTKGMSRARYGSAAENVNSSSRALQIALATAGFYPNIAVQTRNNSPRFLRTTHENEAAIHVSSLAAPRPQSGQRYGRITASEAAPMGTLFSFAQKTQADQQGINLRSVARTFPLAVILFGGRSTRKGQVLTVDEWLPFYVPNHVMFPLLKLNEAMEKYLTRTFSRLGAANRGRILAQPVTSSQEGFLEQDRVRDPLVQGIVQALESCAPRGPLHSPYNNETLESPFALSRGRAWQDVWTDPSSSDRPVSSQISSSVPDPWTSNDGFQLEDLLNEDELVSRPRPLRVAPSRPDLNVEEIFKKWIK